MRVSVIIPTHNEAQSIGRVLADLPADIVTEVLVVDSNSTDGTPEIAAKMGARVLHEPRRGYGRACLTGLAGASSPDVVVFLDGDYSDRPAELPLLLAPIIDGRADITLGSRLGKQSIRGALPWHQVVWQSSGGCPDQAFVWSKDQRPRTVPRRRAPMSFAGLTSKRPRTAGRLR